jgi:hypothetical protein
MIPDNLRQSLLSGNAPRNMRMLIARGMAPLPAGEMLDLLICLINDSDIEISLQAKKSIEDWDENEILSQLQQKDCPTSVLEYFSSCKYPESFLQSIIENSSSSGEIIASLAASAPPRLLETILDNRTRILEFPQILERIHSNPFVTLEVLRLAKEIEDAFLGSKRKEYAIEPSVKQELENSQELQHRSEFESEIELLISEPPLEDLALEGLPIEGSDRETAITNRLSSMPAREKIQYALFGSREIRAMLVRDTNKEIARAVLRSPKLRENEVESFAAMRNVAEDVLREIGNSREWIKGYAIVHTLIKNPKTPPAISQRLMFRLRTQDLTLMTRDRSISDMVRHNATRLLKQRANKGAGADKA